LEFLERNDICIAVHNIDGEVLQEPSCQNLLASLAELPTVRFICSVDHVYSQLAWDQTLTRQFNFVFEDVTNFHAYDVELSFENSRSCIQSTYSQQFRMEKVLQGSTVKAKHIFLLLAKAQISQREYYGVNSEQLYQLSFSQFHSSSKEMFKSQIADLVDHGVIRIDPETKCYQIPLPKGNSFFSLRKIHSRILDVLTNFANHSLFQSL